MTYRQVLRLAGRAAELFYTRYMNICTKCDKTLPEDQFHSNGKGGRRRDCIECCKKRNKQYYANNPPLFRGVLPGTKRCPRCEKTLPSSEFPKNRRSSTGLGTYCKPCQSTYLKKRVDTMRDREPAAEKLCPRCERVLDGSLFAPKANSADGLYSWCRECVLFRRIEQTYNITAEQYRVMIKDGCHIQSCGSFENLHVDHDHKCCTGYTSCGKCVRGVLCGMHNRGTGLFRDDPEALRGAADYLERYAALPIATN